MVRALQNFTLLQGLVPEKTTAWWTNILHILHDIFAHVILHFTSLQFHKIYSNKHIYSKAVSQNDNALLQ